MRTAIHYPTFLSTGEAARLLGGYDRRLVVQLIEEGKLPAIRPHAGAQYRVRLEDLESFRDRCTTKVTAFKQKAAA
jgi:excisionase family DNA binding protein